MFSSPDTPNNNNNNKVDKKYPCPYTTQLGEPYFHFLWLIFLPHFLLFCLCARKALER